MTAIPVPAANVVRSRGGAGPLRFVIADVTFTGSYPTGGEPLSPSDVALHSIVAVIGAVSEGAAKTIGYAVGISWNTGTLILYASGTANSGFAERTAGAYAGNTFGRLVFVGT